MTPTNEIVSIMNSFYWYKDQVDTPKEYLRDLRTLAEELGCEGLVKEINNYLEVLNAR